MERKENFKIKATFYKSFDNNANKLAVITEKSEFKPVMMIKNKLDFEKNREDLRKRILYHKPNEVSSKVSSDSEIQKIEEEKNKFKKSLGEITLKNEGINKLHWGESDFDTWVIDEKSLTNEGYIDDWYEIEYSEESVKKFVDKFLGPDNNPECDATDAKESFEDIINTDGIIKLSEAEKETKNILDELCKVCVSTKAKKEEFSKYVGAEFKRYFGELKFQVNEWKKIEEQYYNSELYKSKGCVVGETNLPFTSEPSTDCFDRVISDRKNKIIDKFSEDFFLGNIELFNKCAHKVDSEGKSLETDAFDKYEIVYKSCRYHKCVFKPGELELVLEVKPLGNLNSAVYPIKEDIDQLKEKCITLERGTNDHDFNSVAEKFIVFNVDTILGDCTKDSINGWDGNNVGYTIKIRAYSIDKYLTLNKHSKCYTGKKPIDILTDVFYHFGIIREGEDKYETTNVTPYKLNFTTKYLKHLSESKLSFEGVEKKYRDICKNERGTVVCVGNPFKSGEAKINGVLKKVYFFDRESACDFYDENGKKVEELDKRDVFNEEYIYDMDDSYIYEEDVDKDVEVEELDGVEEPELKLISKLYLNKNGDPFVSEIGSDGTPKKLSYIKVPWTKVVGFSGEELGDGEDVYPSSIRTSKDFYREVDKFECEDDKNTDLWVQLNGEYKQVRTEGKLDASYEYAGGNVLRHTDVSKNTNDYVAYTKVTKLKKLEGSPIYEYSICKYDSNENYAELYNFNGKTFEPTTKEKVKRLKVSAYGNLIEDEKGDYVYCSSKPRMLDGRIRYLHTEDLFEFCKYKSELKIKTIEKNAELINCSTGNRINLKKENQTEYRIPYSVQFNESSYDYLVRTAAKNGEFLFYERSKNRENKNGIFIWGLDTTSDAPKDVDVSKYMYVEKNQTNQAYTYSDSIGRNSVPKHSPIEVDSKDVESKTTLQRPIYLTKYNGKEDDLGSGVLSVQFSSNVSDDSSVSVYRNYSKTTCLLKGGNKKGFNPVKVNEKGSELGGQILPFVSSCPNYKKELPFYKENGEYSFKKHATIRCAGSTTNDFQLIELDEKRAGRGRNFNIVVSELAYDEYNELFYPINPKSKGYDSTKSFRDDNGDVKSAFRDNGKDITKNNRGTSFGFFPNFDLWGDSMVGRGMTIAIMCLYGSPALLTLKTLNNKFDSMIFGKDYKYMYDDSYCTKQKVGGEEYKTYYSSMKKKDDKLTIHMLDFAFWCTFVKSILNAKDFVTGLMTSFSSTLIKQHIDAKISYKAGQDIWWEHEKGNGVNYVDTEATSNGMSPKSMETNQNFEECREGCLSSYQNRVKVVLFEDGSAESELRLGSIVSLSKIMGITPGSDKDKCYVVSEISGGHYNKRVVEKKDIDKNPIIHELILTPCELNKGKTDYIAYPPVSPDMELVRKSGPQSAFVVENYDPSLYNRVRVIYPWQAKFRNLPAGVNNNGQVSAKVVPYLNDVFGENLETLGYDKQNPIKGLQYGKYFRPGRYNRWGDPAQRDMGEATPFIRCTVPKAGNSAGFNIVPDVGSEVMVDYVGGNIERPFVIGGVYSADSMNFMAGSPTIMTIMSTSGHSIRFYDSPEGSLSIWKNMCPIFNSFGAFASPTMSNITSGGQKGLIYGYERCGGSLQITDGLMYTITCSTDSRGITIEAPFGSVDINSLQGVSINCPNGDVSINAKNISLTAGNNISLSSGNNIGKSMFLPTKSLLEGASGNRGLNLVDNAIGSVLNLAKDVAVSVAKSKLQLIDFSLLRCLLEIIFKPVEGTLSISAGRYLVLTAGGGKSPLNAPGFKPDSTLRNGKMNMLKGLFVNNPEIDAQAQTGDNALLTILNNVDTIFKNKRTSCETKYINRMREIKEEYDRAVQGNGDVTDMEKKLHELLYKRADNVKNTTNSLIDKLNKDMSGFAKSINALLGSSYQTILDDVAKCKEAKEKVFYKYNDGTYIKLKVRDRIKYVKLDSFKEFNIFLHGYTIKKNSTGETYNELNVVRSEKPFGENKFIKALTAYEIYKKPDDNLEKGFFDKLDQDVKDMIKYGFDKEIYKEFEELLKKEKESRKEIGEDIEFDERAKNVVHGKNCVYKLVPDSGGSMKLVGSISVLPVTDFFEGLKKIFDEFVDFIKYLKKLSDDLVLLKDVDKVSLKNLENVQYIKCGSDNDKDTSSLEALAEEIKKAKEKNKEECENRDKKMKEKLEEASNTIVRELSTEVSKNDLNNTLFLGADDNNWVSTLKKKNVDKEKSGSTIPDYIKGIFYDGNNVTDLYKKAMTENLKESGENLYYVRVIMLKIMRAFYVTRYNDCLGGIVGNITSSGIGKAVSTSKRRKYSFFESEEAWALFEKAPGDKKSTEYTAYKKRANDFRKVESTFLEFLENNNWKKAQIDNGKMDFDGETSDDFISNFNSAWPKYVASISVQDPKQTGLLGSKTFSVLSGVVAGDDGSLLGGDIAKVLGIDAMRGFLSQNVWDKGQKGGVLMTIDKSSKQFDSDKGSWEDLKFEYDKYRIQDIRKALNGGK